MRQFLFWIIKHPYISIALLVVTTIGLCVKINTLEIDSSAEGLMMEGDPNRDYYESIKEKFGDDNLTVVMIKADNIFTAEVLKTIESMTEEFEGLDGVTRVESITTVNRIQGEGDTLDTGLLIVEIPEDKGELENLRKIAMRNEIYIKNVISSDARASAVNIFTAKPKSKDFNKDFSEKVDEVITKYKGNLEAYQLGTPLTKVTFSSYIGKDQTTLIPYALLVLVIVLFFSFRHFAGMIIPVLTAGLSVVWTFGFMGLVGFPINVITAVIPALLIAVGCTEDIHMISEYYTGILKGYPKVEALRYMARHMGLPILLTATTTVIGFSTVSSINITILKQFGIVAAFGLAVNFIITMMLVPTILRFTGVPEGFKIEDDNKKSTKWKFLESILEKIGNININYKFFITCIFAFLIGVAIIGCFKLQINTDFISYFKERSFIRIRSKDIHETLSGALNFYVVIESENAEGILEPKALRQIARLERFLNDRGKFDKTTSITDHLTIINREMHGGDKNFMCVPDSRETAAQYLLLMDENDISRYLDYDRATANIIVRHNITSSSELRRELKSIVYYCKDNMSSGLKVRITGEGILINNAADAMSRGQVTSLSLTLGSIFIIMSLLFVSFKAGFLSLIPNTMPIIFNFGLMGWLGVPLNTGTCMVATIALGIAIDDTIHFMARYHQEMNKILDQTKAMFDSLISDGKAIIFSAIALAFGFSTLAFSNFNPTIQFGLLSAFVMLTATVSELFVTPMLLVTTQFITLWDLVRVKIQKDITRVSPFFKGLSHYQAKKVILLGNMPFFKAGEYILRQGEKGREMYVLITGKAEVVLALPGGSKKVAVISPGEIVGEMAAVGDGIRSANVIADEDSYLLSIDEKSLDRIARRFPRIATKLFLNISHVLSERLRNIMRM